MEPSEIVKIVSIWRIKSLKSVVLETSSNFKAFTLSCELIRIQDKFVLVFKNYFCPAIVNHKDKPPNMFCGVIRRRSKVVVYRFSIVEFIIGANSLLGWGMSL